MTQASEELLRCDQCGKLGGGHHPACILVHCGASQTRPPLMDKLEEEMRETLIAVHQRRVKSSSARVAYEAGAGPAVTYWNALAQACAVIARKQVEELEADRSFVWKWIERAIFDKTLSKAECLSTLACYPGAPWNNGGWDVDHKPYAERFYKRFPRAALHRKGVEPK